MRDNTKSPACMRGVTRAAHTGLTGFEATRKSSKDSGIAPLSFSRKRHTASGGALGHESVSMPSAHAVGTAFKTGRTTEIQGFKVEEGRLKSSKDYPRRQSLSFTASDAHESESSKDWFGREPSSKDFGGVGA